MSAISGFGIRSGSYASGAPIGSRYVGAGFRRANDENNGAIWEQRAIQRKAGSAERATCSPKRAATSVENLLSSSAVDTGFSALPLGYSLAARSLVPLSREIARRTGHADGYFAVRSSATVTLTRP